LGNEVEEISKRRKIKITEIENRKKRKNKGQSKGKDPTFKHRFQKE
jgi:hypothetical protein